MKGDGIIRASWAGTVVFGVGAVASNLYRLSGAPSAVRAQLFGSLAVEVTVAFGTAAARPYTIAATAILAPVYALGLCGLWSARYGTFSPRKPPPKRNPRRK